MLAQYARCYPKSRHYEPEILVHKENQVRDEELKFDNNIAVEFLERGHICLVVLDVNHENITCRSKGCFAKNISIKDCC